MGWKGRRKRLPGQAFFIIYDLQAQVAGCGLQRLGRWRGTFRSRSKTIYIGPPRAVVRCTRFQCGRKLAGGIHRQKTERQEGHESKDCEDFPLRAAGCRQRLRAKADRPGAARRDGDAGTVCAEHGARHDEPEEGRGAGRAGLWHHREGRRTRAGRTSTPTRWTPTGPIG